MTTPTLLALIEIEARLRLAVGVIRRHEGGAGTRLAVAMRPEVDLAPEDPRPHKAILAEVDSHQT